MSTVEKPHKYADLLRAVADGKQIQVDTGTGFVDVTHKDALLAMVDDDVCRVKPDMIIINGVECPKPMAAWGNGTWEVSVYTKAIGHTALLPKRFWFGNERDASQVADALIKPLKECHG